MFEPKTATLRPSVPFGKKRLSVAVLVRRPRGSTVLNEALGIHCADGLLIDICFNRGSMWRDLAYQPLRCDIDAGLPNLDVVADWNDLPNFVGVAHAMTIVADPLFVTHVGKKSVWRRYASDRNEFDADNVIDQVADILRSARAMLDPVRGTLILKLGDQVHHSERTFAWFEVLQLAKRQSWYLCDERVENGANMADPKRLHRRHFDSQVRWLVLHTGARCPGPGLLLAGRARCSYCGRVVACERVGKTNYCRPPRGCKYAAYRQRKNA